MRISEKGLSLIKEFEGCQLDAYRCPSHVLTIGWGHVEDVYEGQSITQDEADNLLISDMVKYEGYVNDCDSFAFTPNQNQFDALVSFTYNCGQGSLNTLVENRDASLVADKLLLYINGNFGVLAGLVRRRESERELFLSEDCESVQDVVQATSDNWIARLQKECNNQGFSNQVIDGIPGINTLKGCPTIKLGASGNITKLLQEKLGINADGIFGEQTRDSIVSFQVINDLWADGIVGQGTWSKLLGI